MKLIFLFLFTPLFILANEKESIGFITKLQGHVIVIDTTSKNELVAEKGTKIYNHYAIQTTAKSKAQLVLKNGTIVNVGTSSFFEVENFFSKGENFNSSIKLFYGKIRSIVKPNQDKNMVITTPAAVMGVRGTDFYTIFDRNFKKQFSESSVYTISGEVTLKRKNTPDETTVIVPAGTFSSVIAKHDGNIDAPSKPTAISPEILHSIQSDFIPEPPEKNIKLINENLLPKINPDIALSPMKNIPDEKQEIVFKNDIDTVLKGDDFNLIVENTDDFILTSRAEPIIEEPQTQTDIISPKKSTLSEIEKKDLIQKDSSPVTLVQTDTQQGEIIESLNKSSILENTNDIPEWIKISELKEKKGKNSRIRFLRHPDLSEKHKKLTKLTTLDALFFDKVVKIKRKIAPSRRVKKITTKAFTEENEFLGYEIEFLIEPGSYYVSIDNGPVNELTIEPIKEIIIKPSVILSPGSEYSIFNSLTKTFISFRDKGNPIFVIPGLYKISKYIADSKGIYTNKRELLTLDVEPNIIFTPKFDNKKGELQ